MKYGDKHMIHTDLYKPNAKACCEACVFGRGVHESWCSGASTGEAQSQTFTTKTGFTLGGVVKDDGTLLSLNVGGCCLSYPYKMEDLVTEEEDPKTGKKTIRRIGVRAGLDVAGPGEAETVLSVFEDDHLVEVRAYYQNDSGT